MRFIEDLSQDTIQLLQKIYQKSKHHRVRQRAQCMLLSYQGYTIKELAHIFHVDRITIYNWFSNWESRRFAGLYDRKGKGRHIRRYLSSDPLLPTVHKRFMISQFKDGLKSKLRSSRSCITLRMSPLGVAPQVSDHGFEGSTIPWPSSIAQGSKYLRQDIGWGHRSLAGRHHHLKQMLSSMC